MITYNKHALRVTVMDGDAKRTFEVTEGDRSRGPAEAVRQIDYSPGGQNQKPFVKVTFLGGEVSWFFEPIRLDWGILGRGRETPPDPS